MTLEAALGIKQATTTETIALSLIKKNAQVDQQIANVVAKGAASATAAASGRGQVVDLSV